MMPPLFGESEFACRSKCLILILRILISIQSPRQGFSFQFDSGDFDFDSTEIDSDSGKFDSGGAGMIFDSSLILRILILILAILILILTILIPGRRQDS